MKSGMTEAIEQAREINFPARTIFAAKAPCLRQLPQKIEN
jgi:hypothetical protein